MESIDKYCQSCAMPMNKPEDYGTNSDDSKNDYYCAYCYKNGEFTSEMTMEQMIEYSAPYMAEANEGMTEEQAKEQMHKFFPELKRWKK